MGNRLEELVVCDAVRTPFGHGNILREHRPQELLAGVIQSLIKRNNLDPNQISAVITGAVMQDSRNTNIARIASMLAGLPQKTTDYTVHANCNSGFTGLTAAVGEIMTGEGELFISSSVENMSLYGFRLEDKSRQLGSVAEIEELIKEKGAEILDHFRVVDCLMEGLTDLDNNISMIEIGEVMANCFHISREDQDQYTRRNLQRALEAVESGVLSAFITPMDATTADTYPLNRKRMLKREDSFGRAAAVFGADNPELPPERFYLKHQQEMERLGIKAITPTVTMYNACIPGNGAGGCIITTETKAKELGLTPKLRLINWAKAGVNPVIMGIGPMESTYKLFQKAKTQRAQGISFNDLDMIEIHEAFASQVLSVYKESERKYGLKWDQEKVNMYGGSLAFTHPLGATNFRLLTNILSRFDQDPQARYAMAAGCAGGGLGTSLLFERYL